MRLNLGVVPFSKPAQSTPNVVLIYNHANCGTLLDVVQGTMSTTHSPRMVNDNNHAHTPISCDVPVHMKCNYVISCLCHVTHTHTHTHTHIYIYIWVIYGQFHSCITPMHHWDNYINQHTISNYITQIMSTY